VAERLERLTRRAEFLKVAGSGRKWVAPGLILQARRRDGDVPAIRLGFTASRKVGIAVLRNRARRRLRAAAAAILPAHATAGHDYVLIARGETVRRPYPALVEDLRQGLRRLGLWRDGEERTAAHKSELPAC
jgi:ribonuclease P protein component